MDALPALGFTPAVGDLAFTPQQRSLLSLANELGRDALRAARRAVGREASFPFANYDDLRAGRPAGDVRAARRTAAWAPTTPPT